ncbi:transmembrane alpha-helix domain-containing protein [Stemphylium lycopersici]|nr:transmembrane alpha-helix domain-containing protein [Stemphylium lycopersici]
MARAGIARVAYLASEQRICQCLLRATRGNATPTTTGESTGTGAANPFNTGSTELQNAAKEDSGGLTLGGKTAIAVVIPVMTRFNDLAVHAAKLPGCTPLTFPQIPLRANVEMNVIARKD